ncbi:hypothetical protein EON65_14395 [archaeon]|nr:MAG: hypothetical protein EON65_14395 [archaeon]
MACHVYYSASPQARKQLSNYRRAHALLSHKPTHAKRQTTRRDYSAWAMSVSVDDAIDGTVRREGKGRLQSTEDIEYNPCTQAFTVGKYLVRSLFIDS